MARRCHGGLIAKRLGQRRSGLDLRAKVSRLGGQRAPAIRLDALEGITQGNARLEPRLDPLEQLLVGGTQGTRLPFTEPVEFRLGLDIAVPHDLGLAGEPHLVLVADLEPADGDADLFEQGLGSEILHTLGNVNPAFAALTETSTVQDTLDARVELDLISDSHITQLLSLIHI